MGGTCSTYGRGEQCAPGYGGENLNETGRMEDLELNRRIILKWILRWVGPGVA